MNKNLAKQLRQLPYADMMALAHIIKKQLAARPASDIDACFIAAILSSLPIEGVSESIQQEEKILREIFRRKRSINVQRVNNGWEIDIPALQAGQVVGTELRPMFSMQLDQLITMNALCK